MGIKNIDELEVRMREELRNEVNNELKELNEALSVLVEAENDIRHMIEDSEKVGIVKGYMFYKAYQRILRSRRVVKRRINTLSTIIEELDKGKCSLSGAIDRARRHEQHSQSKRVLENYSLKRLSSKDIDNVPIMAQVTKLLESTNLTHYEEEYAEIYPTASKEKTLVPEKQCTPTKNTSGHQGRKHSKKGRGRR